MFSLRVAIILFFSVTYAVLFGIIVGPMTSESSFNVGLGFGLFTLIGTTIGLAFTPHDSKEYNKENWSGDDGRGEEKDLFSSLLTTGFILLIAYIGVAAKSGKLEASILIGIAFTVVHWQLSRFVASMSIRTTRQITNRK